MKTRATNGILRSALAKSPLIDKNAYFFFVKVNFWIQSFTHALIRHACLSRSDFGYDLGTVNYAKDDDYGQKNMHGSE